MIIVLTPARLNTRLDLIRTGDSVTINGEKFDFSPLPDGATLPAEATNSDWFTGPVERIDGTLYVSVALPFGRNAPEATLFPAPVVMDGDGPVPLPPYDTPEPDVSEVDGYEY